MMLFYKKITAFIFLRMCASFLFEMFYSLLHTFLHLGYIYVYSPHMLPGLVPTAVLALWWQTVIISSPIYIQWKEQRQAKGGVVVQLMLVPHSSANKTYSSGPSLSSKVSTTECHVTFFSAVSQCTISARSVWSLILLICLDVTHMEVQSTS